MFYSGIFEFLLAIFSTFLFSRKSKALINSCRVSSGKILDSDKKIELIAKKLITAKGKIQHRGQALSGVKVNAGMIG